MHTCFQVFAFVDYFVTLVLNLVLRLPVSVRGHADEVHSDWINPPPRPLDGVAPQPHYATLPPVAQLVNHQPGSSLGAR